MEFLGVNPGINIFGLHIAWYGILIAFAMFSGIIIASKVSRYRDLTSDNILGVALWVIPLCILSARLYYVIFSGRSYTFVEFFKIWEGGMAIYGGIIGGAVGALIYCLIHKKNFFAFTDVLAPCLALGQAIGRWGNFINQEAFGFEVTNKALQWFPYAVYIEAEGKWHMATFFYESLGDIITFIVLMIMLVKWKRKGTTTAGYFVLYGITRAIVEGFRTDSLWIGSLRVSQLLSIILIAVGVVLFVYYGIKEYQERKNKPESQVVKK